MNILDLIVGKPIKTSDERAEQIGIRGGIHRFKTGVKQPRSFLLTASPSR